MAYEALCSYRTYTQLAQALAAAGFDVLRFDYHGTGDSAGDDGDPERVESWLASTHAAIVEAVQLSGAREVALFGMRLGATIAVQAALRHGGVSSLMLWAPCTSGRAFIREMRAASGIRSGGAQAGGLEALGALFTDETLTALNRLDARQVKLSPARSVLVIGRDDMPGEGALPARYREFGADVTYTAWPGYAGMMAEPHEAVLAPDTLASITQWLCSKHAPVTQQENDSRKTPWAGDLVMGAVVERPVSFGGGRDLFGLLAEARTHAVANPRGDTAVLMLNVGGNYRIGPNRIYVKAARELAAAGYRTLRFDVGGIGDSRVEAGFSSDNMYRDDATADVSAAIDMLVARGCRRIFLMGICSGAYLAFQTGLQDARVTGVMLMNSRLLEWDAHRRGPWQSSMQQYYKSTRYYRQALLRSDVYTRLLRGEVDVRGITGRLWDLARARITRAFDRLRHAPPHEGVLAKFKHLSKRGAETLVVMSEQDDGLDYMEFHLGPAGSRMRGQRGFRMVLIPDADHTFSTVASQRALIDVLRDHLNRLHEAEPSPARLPARVATT
jgi:alpha-beta hydrolase superfamily lysophospholipase